MTEHLPKRKNKVGQKNRLRTIWKFLNENLISGLIILALGTFCAGAGGIGPCNFVQTIIVQILPSVPTQVIDSTPVLTPEAPDDGLVTLTPAINATVIPTTPSFVETTAPPSNMITPTMNMTEVCATPIFNTKCIAPPTPTSTEPPS